MMAMVWDIRIDGKTVVRVTSEVVARNVTSLLDGVIYDAPDAELEVKDSRGPRKATKYKVGVRKGRAE